MEVLRNFVKQIGRWVMRFRVALDESDARERLRPEREVEWNGEMIGDMKRRRFLDA
jgi:hypothetical protein